MIGQRVGLFQKSDYEEYYPEPHCRHDEMFLRPFRHNFRTQYKLGEDYSRLTGGAFVVFGFGAESSSHLSNSDGLTTFKKPRIFA